MCDADDDDIGGIDGEPGGDLRWLAVAFRLLKQRSGARGSERNCKSQCQDSAGGADSSEDRAAAKQKIAGRLGSLCPGIVAGWFGLACVWNGVSLGPLA